MESSSDNIDSNLLYLLLEEKVKECDEEMSVGMALQKRFKFQLALVVNCKTFKSNTSELSMDESFIAVYRTGPGIEEVTINLLNFYKELENVAGKQMLDDALLKYNEDYIQ